MTYLISVSILVSLTRCDSRSSESESSDSAGHIEKSVTRPVLIVDHFDEIKLERGPCFGTCPIYNVTVRSDGQVLYEGEAFVKIKDTARGSISAAQVRALDTAIARADYFSLRDKYHPGDDVCPDYLSDFPTVITSVTMVGRTKMIVHNHGCWEPNTQRLYARALADFEMALDSIIGTEKWVGTDDERPTTW